MMKELGHSSDLSVRMVESPHQKSLKPAVIHLDGLAYGNIIMAWKELIPTGITVPFGELIMITMILPYFNKKSSAVKVGHFA
ncbi:hypothetical protein [Peribacillus frigoritolerans]|uniref:hypothetical protein n=2 Tax=Peribacillus frigoritolerans TaxID=450367 RepID=UPI001F0A4ECD|nr:hypothetical protein [Peribacillus frigoritolerans]MED3847314.1 hypothetical protein [Peribacillus frigoritolerans]WVN13463.1 hypothetical protein V2I71_13120 [Peribacillus frigoritolerans]